MFLYRPNGFADHLRNPSLPETTAPAVATAAAADFAADRRSSGFVATHGVSKHHRAQAAVHAHGGRVRARAQKIRDRRDGAMRMGRPARRGGGLCVGRGARRPRRVRPSTAVAIRARECCTLRGLR